MVVAVASAVVVVMVDVVCDVVVMVLVDNTFVVVIVRASILLTGALTPQQRQATAYRCVSLQKFRAYDGVVPETIISDFVSPNGSIGDTTLSPCPFLPKDFHLLVYSLFSDFLSWSWQAWTSQLTFQQPCLHM